MNAPTTIRVDESTTERAHRHAITIHCPNEPEMSMAARCDIALIRDQASVGINRATGSVAVILREIATIATGAVYQPLPTNTLVRVRGSLQLMLDAARILERTVRNG